MTNQIPADLVPESSPEIIVVGSINLDLSLTVDRFPEAGQTIHGRDVVWGGGGKGANQAVAAARLGRRVAMVGRVGDDAVGAARRASLAAEGIDVELVAVQPGMPTGLAVIEVDDAGENRIVVIAGANTAVGVGVGRSVSDRSVGSDLDRAAEAVEAASVVLTQFEVPLPTVAAVARMPRTGRLILNPAPVPPAGHPSLPELLGAVDVVVPNRGELAALVGHPEPGSVDEVVDQVRLIEDGPDAAVVTLGADGALVAEGLRAGSPHIVTIDPLVIDPVDTTAAGDAFCGALADALCDGAGYADAAAWANRVAAVTATRRGAQDSLPTRAEVIGFSP